MPTVSVFRTRLLVLHGYSRFLFKVPWTAHEQMLVFYLQDIGLLAIYYHQRDILLGTIMQVVWMS